MRAVVLERSSPLAAALWLGATRQNHQLRQKNSGRTQPANVPLLTSALAIALRLIGIDLAHFFEEVLCVRSRNIRRTRPSAIALFWSPRSRFHRLLNALRHTKI